MALLQRERDAVTRRWDAVGDVSPAITSEVVDGLIAALGGSTEQLDELGEKLAASPGELSAADVGSLRSIVHHLCITELPRDEATRAVAAVSATLDGLIATLHDAEIARLESAALTDVLTGAGNRRALEREFPQMQAAAARHGEPIALVLIDLDELKGINDRYGHPAGDAALCKLASGLGHEQRGADAVYRLGGDEFVLLLSSTDAEGAEEVLKRLPADLPRFSYGVASAPSDGDGLVEVLEAADQRLLDAKAGRPTAPAAALLAAGAASRPRQVARQGIAALTLCAVVLVVSILAGRVDDVSATMAMQAVAISAMSLAAIGLVSRAAPLHRALAAAPVALGLWLALGVGPVPSPLAPLASDPTDTTTTETALAPTTVPDETPTPAATIAPTPTPAPAATPAPAPARPRTATPAPSPAATTAPTAPVTSVAPVDTAAPAPAAPVAPTDTEVPSGGTTVGGASDAVTPPPPAPTDPAPAVDEPVAGECTCVRAQAAPADEPEDSKHDRRRRDKRDEDREDSDDARHDGGDAAATTLIVITVPPVSEAVGAEATDAPSGDAAAVDAPSGEGADVVSAEPTTADAPVPAIVATTIEPAESAVPTEVPEDTPAAPAATTAAAIEPVVDTSEPVSPSAAPVETAVVDC